MTREEIIAYWVSERGYGGDSAEEFATWHIAEIEPLRQALEKLLRRRDALDFIEGKDAYMQVDVNDMNNALNLLKLAREVA